MMKNILKTTVLASFLLVGVFFALPNRAEALFLDKLFEDAPFGPHCLLMDCDSTNEPPVVNNTINNSINGSFNDNVNSLNGNGVPIVTQQGGITGLQPTYTTPVYSYNSPTPTYQTPELYASCYPTPTQITVGSSAQWRSSINGGNGTYYVSWSGSDGLSGTGDSIHKTYTSAGTKSATITVTSGGKTISRNCSGSVSVSGNNTYYSDYYYYPTYPTYPTYYPLSVTCQAHSTYTQVGSSVYWSAYASGGSGSYSYSWSGTDGMYGSGSTANAYYSTAGTKTAWVTVYSGGQQATAQCSGVVIVSNSQYYQPQSAYYQPVSYTIYPSGLQVACAADTTHTRAGIPVTWSAEATYNGSPVAGLGYSWTGSEGLYGSQSSAVNKYSSVGTKTASVTVIGPNNQTITKKCSNSVYVGTTVAKTPVSKEISNKPSPEPSPVYLIQPHQMNAGLFSLNNVPWGWVAVLVILVLIGTIFYLIFNRRKI